MSRLSENRWGRAARRQRREARKDAAESCATIQVGVTPHACRNPSFPNRTRNAIRLTFGLSEPAG